MGPSTVCPRLYLYASRGRWFLHGPLRLLASMRGLRCVVYLCASGVRWFLHGTERCVTSMRGLRLRSLPVCEQGGGGFATAPLRCVASIGGMRLRSGRAWVAECGGFATARSGVSRRWVACGCVVYLCAWHCGDRWHAAALWSCVRGIAAIGSMRAVQGPWQSLHGGGRRATSESGGKRGGRRLASIPDRWQPPAQPAAPAP